MQSSFLPQLTKCEQPLCPVYRRIVNYNDRLSFNTQREVVKDANHGVCINAVCRCEPMCPTIAVNHGETIEPRTPAETEYKCLPYEISIRKAQRPPRKDGIRLRNKGLLCCYATSAQALATPKVYIGRVFKP